MILTLFTDYLVSPYINIYYLDWNYRCYYVLLVPLDIPKMAKASPAEKLALSFDESPWPKWYKAQLGNLNKDSTHPNPWYPPTQYERMGSVSLPYRIYRDPRITPEPLKPLRNFLEEDDLVKNIGWAARKGFVLGLAFAVNDILVINNIDTRKARFVIFNT